MATYEEGFEAGRREAARLLLDAEADWLQALAGRLAGAPVAVSACNESSAIIRDAARELDWTPPPEPPAGEEPEPAEADGELARPPARTSSQGARPRQRAAVAAGDA